MITFKVDSIAKMNGALREFLEYLKNCEVSPDAVFDSRLVSCELITNVLRHSDSPALFSGRISGGDIIISVCGDERADVIPEPTLPDVFAEGGRGLYIINAVSGGNVSICGGKVTVILKTK